VVPGVGGPESVREGVFEWIGNFRLHAFGCQVEFGSGEIVAFDWDRGGRRVYDAWRLRAYARSRGLDDADQESPRKAARSIVNIVDARPGCFTCYSVPRCASN